MLNEYQSLLSLSEAKDVLFFDLTIFHIALVYILMYVVYKALGRYVYFKPQEHASKINRTFLALSLLTVALHNLSGAIAFLPILPEYRWIYAICGLVLFAALLSILADRVVWDYESNGGRKRRDWRHDFLPIRGDYYKTNVWISENRGNHVASSREEEGVRSTEENIHSDVLLNILALIVFCIVCTQWAHASAVNYGWLAYIFSFVSSLSIAGIFLNETIFSWIKYLERKLRD